MSKRNTNKAKNWAITFPQTDCERKVFVDSFPPYEEVICAREEHKDGGFHLHLGIKLVKGITKMKLLEFIRKRWPDDYKRIDVQGTRSISQWTDYICKEDSEVFRDVNATVSEAREKMYMKKVKELSTRAMNTGYDNSTSWKGAIEVRKLKERWCTGCNTVCPECETQWREYWKKMEKASEQD